MFGFKKKLNKEREDFRREFEHVASRIWRAPTAAKIVLGHTINETYTMFLARFHSIDAFRLLPRDQQLEYVQQLSAMEVKLQKEEPPASLGVGLFKMWVGTIITNDDVLMRQFSKELAVLSHGGEWATQAL